MKLYQFPISHFCEKARWALDFMRFEYETVNLVPGLHLKTTNKLGVRSSVPILQDGSNVIAGSSQILDYLEQLNPASSLMPTDKKLAQQVRDWESRLDSTAGIDVRLAAYHILLKHPEIVKPFFTHNGPWYGGLFLLLAFKKLTVKMRHLMKINDESFEQAKQNLHTVLDELNQHYQTNQFLVGDQFSRADLTAAALFAPLVMPEGYGLNWPKQVPDDFQQLQKEFADKLTWLAPLYKTYR